MSQLITPLTLYTSVYDYQEYDFWDFDDSTDGSDFLIGRAYKWTATFTIQPQRTGNFLTGGYYTEYDIQVGDWIAMGTYAPILTLQIKEILSVDGGIVTAILEDVDRYNIHLTGDKGINRASEIGNFDCLTFRIGEDGLPILSSLIQQQLPDVTYQEILSRFLFRNYYQNNFIVSTQLNNTFAVGDEIYLGNDGIYRLASGIGASAYKVVGRVKDINIPKTGYFTFEPKGKLVRYINPSLPGLPGDIIYLDPNNPGKLTSTFPNTGVAIPIFIKIEDHTGIKLDEIMLGGLDNFNGSNPPTANDDSTLGYGYGSIWVDRVHRKSYINVDPRVGESVWQLIGSGSGSSITPIASETVLGSVKIGDNINVTEFGVISVSKGAGINKVVDIPDVYSQEIVDKSILKYNAGLDRWDVTHSLDDLPIDGGQF